MVKSTDKKQKKAIQYYDKLSKIYDYVSNWYYRKVRRKAIFELKLRKDQTVLNVPCGTGVNFKLFQQYLESTGLVIGIDLSTGMLQKANNKIRKSQQ